MSGTKKILGVSESMTKQETFNKQDLINYIAENKGGLKKDAAAAVEKVVGSIKELLTGHTNVHLAGFGNFDSVFKEEHEMINNFNGEKVTVPAHYVAKAKLSKTI